ARNSRVAPRVPALLTFNCLTLLHFNYSLRRGTRVRSWARTRRRSRPRRRSRWGWRHSRRRRHSWCWRHSWRGRRPAARTDVTVEDFHRGNYRQATVVAACFPDIISAISVGGEVTPSDCEWSTDRPRITNRVVDVHLIFGGVKIPTQDIHQVT